MAIRLDDYTVLLDVTPDGWKRATLEQWAAAITAMMNHTSYVKSVHATLENLVFEMIVPSEKVPSVWLQELTERLRHLATDVMEAVAAAHPPASAS